MNATSADLFQGPRAAAARFADALCTRYRGEVLDVRLFGSCTPDKPTEIRTWTWRSCSNGSTGARAAT